MFGDKGRGGWSLDERFHYQSLDNISEKRDNRFGGLTPFRIKGKKKIFVMWLGGLGGKKKGAKKGG